MADGEYQLRITSAADLTGIEKAQAELARLKATLQASGGDTSGVEKMLDGLAAASNSSEAQAAKAVAGWQAVREQISKLGGDTGPIDVEIGKQQAKLSDAKGAGTGDKGPEAGVGNLAALQQFRAAAAAAGHDTKALDAQIAALQKTMDGGVGKRLVADLERQIVALKAAGQSTAALDAQLAAVRGTQPLSGIAGALQSIGSAAAQLPGGAVFASLGAGAGITAVAVTGVTAAIAALNHGLNEYADRQAAVARVDQQLANAGRLTGEYREQIQRLADTFSKVSGIDDTTWLKALGKIQSKDTTANLAHNAELLKNMAARVGDVDTAATLLSRALAGNFQRLEMYGFHVDQGASKTEKLKAIMEQAAKGGAGVYENSLQTLTRQKQGLANASHQLWEGVGRLAFQMGLGGGTAQLLASAIERITNLLPKSDPILDATANKYTVFREAVSQATGKGKDFADHAGDGAEGLNSTGDAASKLVEKLDKATAAMDAYAAAALRDTDSDTGFKIAKVDEKQATTEAAQGGKLTAQQKAGFDRERLGIRRDADKRKLDIQEWTAEQNVEEVAIARKKPEADLAKAQAAQAKADAAILKLADEAGMAPEMGTKPAEQAGKMDAEVNRLRAELLAARKERSALVENQTSQWYGDTSIETKVADSKRAAELKASIAATEAKLKPFDTAAQAIGDLKIQAVAAEKEVQRLQEDNQTLYLKLQGFERALKVIRVQKGTAEITGKTQEQQGNTKATAEGRDEEKKKLDVAIKLNEERLKAAAPGAEKDALAQAQRRMQGRKVELELIETPEPTRRQQIVERAERDGFTVNQPAGRPPRVTSQTVPEMARTDAGPRPVQTVAPTPETPIIKPPEPAAPRLATPTEVARSRWEQDNAARNRKHAEEKAQNAAFKAKYDAERAAKRAEEDAITAAEDQARGYKSNGQPLDAPATPPVPITPPTPPAPVISVPETPAPVVTPAAPAAPVTLPTPTAPVVSVPETPAPVVTPAAPAAPVALPTPTAPVVNVPETPTPVLTPAAPAAPVTLPTPTAPVVSVPETPAPVVVPAAAEADKAEPTGSPPGIVAGAALGAATVQIGNFADRAVTTAQKAYDTAAAVVEKTGKVLEKVEALAAAPGTAGEGAAAAAKVTALGAIVEKNVGIATEAAAAGNAASKVATIATKLNQVAGPLALLGTAVEAGKLAHDFKGQTGRVEAGVGDRGALGTVWQGASEPLTTIATALKILVELQSLNAQNRAAAGEEAPVTGPVRPTSRPSLHDEPENKPMPAAAAAEPTAMGGDKLSPPLPPAVGGDKLVPPQVGPPVSFAPVVSGLDDSAKAMTAGGKAVAEAAKRVNQAAQDRNDDILAALEALAERDAAMSARLDAINQRLQYGPS